MYLLSFHTTGDEALFHRFAAGEQDAFGELYNRLYTPLTRYGRWLGPNEFEVSVMAGDAFLRLWELRHRITSLLHAYRFLRLVLRWQCADYYRHPARRFQHSLTLYTGTTEYLAVAENDGHLHRHRVQEEQAQAVYEVIPCLPPTRQTMVRLYFGYGLTCKQIAARFRTSNTAVSGELQKSLDYLKAILRKTKQGAVVTGRPLQLAAPPPGILTATQQQVVHLRRCERRGFGQIAALLGMSQAEVQVAYVQACRLLADGAKRAGSTPVTAKTAGI